LALPTDAEIFALRQSPSGNWKESPAGEGGARFAPRWLSERGEEKLHRPSRCTQIRTKVPARKVAFGNSGTVLLIYQPAQMTTPDLVTLGARHKSAEYSW